MPSDPEFFEDADQVTPSEAPDGPGQEDFMAKVRRYTALENRKRRLDTELKQVKKEVEELKPQVLEQMGLNGIDNFRVDGLTLYRTSKLFVSKKSDQEGITKEQAAEALNRAGMGYLVAPGFNTNSLRSAIREMKERGEPIPPDIERCFNIIEQPELSTRRT